MAVAFLVTSVMIHVLTRRNLRAQLDHSLAAEARALAVLVEQEDGQLESDLGEQGATDTEPGVAPRYVELWDDRGQSLERSPTLGDEHLPAVTGPLDSVVYQGVRLPGGVAGRQATLTFVPRQDDEPAGAAPPRRATLAVARDVRALDETMARLRTVLVVAGAVTTVLSLLLLAWIARYGLRPVRRLADDLEAVRADDLSARFDAVEVPVELQPMVERLNGLLARLEAAFGRERELTAELAHELRTPIAGIRAVLELALSQEREPARYQRAMAEVLTISGQVERLIEALLKLARLDAGLVVARPRPVVVADVVEEVIASCGQAAAAREVTVRSSLAGAGSITSDADLVRLVVWNLIDNAVSHGDAGSTVDVALTVDDAALTLVIENSGSRLAQADVERAFERFWRGDEARSDRGHVGLGLALGRKVIAVLGGTLTIRSSAGGTFVATVTLPRTGERT